MDKKIARAERLEFLAASENLSTLANSNLSKSSQEVTRFGSVLTDIELQSLREEMIRDGAYMKEWLPSKPKKSSDNTAIVHVIGLSHASASRS